MMFQFKFVIWDIDGIFIDSCKIIQWVMDCVFVCVGFGGIDYEWM